VHRCPEIEPDISEIRPEIPVLPKIAVIIESQSEISLIQSEIPEILKI